MKKTYQAWVEEENGRVVSTTLCTPENIQNLFSNGLLDKAARFLYQIEADTPEEAMAVHHIKLGREPFVPQGKPMKCPNGCGGFYYPEGSGECPNCGKIC